MGLVEMLAEVLCPPSHREGLVVSIVGKPTEFGPTRTCLLHRVMAENAAKAVRAHLAALAQDERVRERVALAALHAVGEEVRKTPLAHRTPLLTGPDAAVAAFLAAVEEGL